MVLCRFWDCRVIYYMFSSFASQNHKDLFHLFAYDIVLYTGGAYGCVSLFAIKTE